MFQNDFIDFLAKRMQNKLPGIDSHLEMAPVIDGKPFRKFKPEQTARKSAVLIPLIKRDNKLKIIFTLRSSKLKSHSGQISFPGGRAELGETSVMTALRESNEEIGLPYKNIKVLGVMSNLFVPPSNSVITPVLGLIDQPFDYVLSEDEVEEVFEVDFDDFLCSDFYCEEIWDFKGVKVDVPFWKIHSKVPLWGATAMILSELLWLHKEYEKNQRSLDIPTL